MKRILISIASVACAGWMAAGYAANSPANPALVIQVPDTFYEHPVRLLNPYANYWHNRGEAADRVSLQTFQARQYSATSCKADAKGQALVVIEPNLFYNPQMGIFHTEITAKVYTQPAADSALGKPLVTAKGQGESRGWITYNVENFARKSYQQAFDQVIQQLQKNPVFQQSVAQGSVQNFEALCTSINTITQPKIFF
jgi:hypothetical protein